MCGRLLLLLVLFYFIIFRVVNHLNSATAVEEGDTFLCTNRSLILISVAVTLPNIESDTS